MRRSLRFIRSSLRIWTAKFGRTKSFWYGREKILTPKLHTGGYLRVVLYNGGRPKDFYVHKLVAETFLPNPNNLPEVNHIVGMKFNCHVSNLVWSTSSDNVQHAYDTGLQKSGEDHYESLLTNDEIRLIRKIHVKRDKNFSAAEPTMADIGMLASTDILAIDQACCDLVWSAADSKDLRERIESRRGLHQLTAMRALNMGNPQYELISIDQGAKI